MGGRSRRNARRHRRPRPGITAGDRIARRLALQAHRRRGVCRLRFTEVRRRCRDRRTVGSRVAGADGIGDRRSRIARRRLLRRGAESRGARDGRRARRPDPADRLDGGSAQRSRLAGSRAAPAAGPADHGRGVPGPGARTAHRVSRAAGAGHESREPAPRVDQLRRSRIRGRPGAFGHEDPSVGDADRCRRGRQDPAGHRGRRAFD